MEGGVIDRSGVSLHVSISSTVRRVDKFVHFCFRKSYFHHGCPFYRGKVVIRWCLLWLPKFLRYFCMIPLTNWFQISVAVVSKFIYNIYFRHRGIPTKVEMSATDWGLWRFSKNGDSHLKVQELHKELGIKILLHDWLLGDVVRIQPNHISFMSLTAMEEIHGTRSAAQKAPFYRQVLRRAKFPSNLVNVMFALFVLC